jgi:hypothetical protein
MSDPRYYPPGLSRTDPTTHLYDLVYQQQDALQALQNAANNSTPKLSVTTATIRYVDWNGNNQSVTVVTGVSLK